MLRAILLLLLTFTAPPTVDDDDADPYYPPLTVPCGSDTFPRTIVADTVVYYGSYETEAEALAAAATTEVGTALFQALLSTVFWSEKCAECPQPTATPRCIRQLGFLSAQPDDIETIALFLPATGRWTLRMRAVVDLQALMRCRLCQPPAF